MGIAIGYSGQATPASFGRFERLVNDKARRHNWQVVRRDSELVSRIASGLWRKPDIRPSVTVFAHADCEPIEFDFDQNWRLDNFVKTSFAPIEVHVGIIDLLEGISSSIFPLDIEDEGEYYPNHDIERLERNRDAFFAALQAQLDNGAVGPVRLDSGRIVDCVSPEN